MVTFELDPDNPPPLTAEQKARLARLAEMPKSAIDTTDIPELDWTTGIVVHDPFAQPPTKSRIKEFLIDSDIIYWILNQVGEEGYQDKMNAMLRRAMDEERAER